MNRLVCAATTLVLAACAERGGEVCSGGARASEPSDGGWILSDDFVGGVSRRWSCWDLGKHTASPRETPETSPNVALVDSPGRVGEKAWQLTIQPDDYTSADDEKAHKERAQLKFADTERFVDGTDWWYGWSIYIPAGYDFVSSNTRWQILGQFHDVGVGAGNQPVISIRLGNDATGANLFVRCGLIEAPNHEAEHRSTFRITGGAWTDLKLHVKWAQGNRKGFVDVYANGVEARHPVYRPPPPSLRGRDRGCTTRLRRARR